MSGWVLRAAVAIILGLAIGIWLDWRLGVTVAALVVIAGTLFQAKHGPIVPATALATSAQRKTRKALRGLRRAGYHVLQARAIPGSDQVIDHLVIGPAGVFALDSEGWDKRLPVRTVAGGMLYHGPFSQKERLRHARWEASRASSLVGAEMERDVVVRPAMVIYGPTIPWDVASLRGVDVFAGGRIGKYFKRQARSTRKDRLDPEQIEAISEAAARVLPPVK
jgi:hypothetical protein